jgi:phosphoglycerol transferase
MSTSAPPLPTDAPAATTAPSDGGRPAASGAWKNAAGYGAVVAASLAVMVFTLQLWQMHSKIPLFDGGDNLMSEMFVQNILESGWIFDNARLGAPGALDMRDYPIPDVLHVAIIKVLGYLWHDPVVVLNLYYLLPFPLIALSAYFVLRRFRLGRIAAVVASVLYSSMPYHFLRIEGHLFLSAYYLLPFMIWVILRVYLGRNPFQRLDAAGRRRWRLWTWESAGAALVCVLTGLAGIYYAFFSCFFLLAVGIKTAFRERRWAPLIGTGLPLLLIAGAVAAAVSPSFLYKERNGFRPEAVVRSAVDTDAYALNVTEMLLPVLQHRVPFLQAVRDHYMGPWRRPTGAAAYTTLGFLGSLGFLYLLGRFLWRRKTTERIDDGLAYLNITALVLGTVGGLGSSIAFYGTPMIRCYDRLSIFIAFFALAGLFLVLQRLAGQFVRGRRATLAWGAILASLLPLGAFDQTSERFTPTYKETKSRYEAEVDFGGRIEAVLPAGSMVFELPYMPFPEHGPILHLEDYDLFRPFFHTRTLRWSYGAMKGSEASRWQADVAARPLPDALERLAFAGFRGVYIDRAGFADRGAATESELSRLLGVQPLVTPSPDQRQSFFDMSAYVRDFHGRFTDAEWEKKKEGVLQFVDVRWKNGDVFCLSGQPAGDKDAKWFSNRDQLHVQNYGNHPRRVVLRMKAAGWKSDPVPLRVDGDLAHRELALTQEHKPLELDLLVPPGDHVLSFSSDGPRLPAPDDPRVIIYLMEKFECDIGD